ncbi:hypothetical protein IMSAGC012_00709 [Lachnospiraceae bacterium]|nr:hypothetical protein IMSAGC012_00709 [Lachnospiraceae bacterium]
MFFQLFCIIIQMHGRHFICLVIRIVDKNNIRMTFCKIVFLPAYNRNIGREFPALIVHGRYGTVRILVKIRNRNDIRRTILILFCRPPDALQAVPHRCLIRQKYNFQCLIHLLPHIFPYLRNTRIQSGAHRIFRQIQRLQIQSFAVFFQNPYGVLMGTAVFFQPVSRQNGRFLASCKQRRNLCMRIFF